MFNLNNFSLKLKNIFLCFPQGLFLFSNGYNHNIALTLPNVVKIDVENDNVVSTLSNVIKANLEKTMLIQRCLRLQIPRLLYATLFQCLFDVVRRLINLMPN